MTPKILKLKGDNFEIGRGLGKFWGDYFGSLDRRNGHNKELYNKYKEWLQDDEIDKGRGRFLTNMAQHFPALFYELVGMNVGINESKIGFKTSLFGLFTCWLGETDEDYFKCSGCSSVLQPIKNGFFLAHSDEGSEESDNELKQLPLVIAQVSLKAAVKSSHFISISHPFQLLGSAVGMNRNFAFQGNSIGYNEEISGKLQKTWDKRIPKTVFTRMMLEMSSINEIEALYTNYGSTLPNHHYVVFSDKAYSIEVRPSAEEELGVFKVESVKPQIHSNHFLHGDSHRWAYSGKYEKESIQRRDYLSKKMAGVKSAEDIQAKFLEFLEEHPLARSKNNKLITSTSGAFFFTIQQGKPFSCEGKLYYDGTPFSVSTN